MSAEPFIASAVPVNPADQSRRPDLFEKTREVLRTRHYSQRTEVAYLGWIKRFVQFHGRRHPREMGAAEDVSTTMIYTHALNRGGRGVASPLDRM